MSLRVIPMTIKAANEVVERLHRSHEPAHGALWAFGIAEGDRVVGAVIVGRPCRMLQDGVTVALVRNATDGTRNACSFGLAHAWRVAQLLGWRRMLTYSDTSESGASLRGAGFRQVGMTKGGKWSRESRPRSDRHVGRKLRWEKVA